MKLIIAHISSDAFEPVRQELLELGVHRTTISGIHTSGTRPATTLQYRGAVLHAQLRPELRLECFVTAQQLRAVVDVLRGYANRAGTSAGPVAVVDLEELHVAAPQSDVLPGDPRLDEAVL